MKSKWQKKITLPQEKIEVVTENFGKMKNRELARMIGVTYGILHNNLRLLGFVKTKHVEEEVSPDMFDVDDFGKHYAY